jgi:APA family basic amino acid/polyamine antiporter
MAVAAGEAPTLFLRKATGLVKGWSGFDAFIYSFLSVNLVTLAMYGISLYAYAFPEGQLLPAVIGTGILVTLLVVTYAGLVSAMPRAGGDYVWQSRILGGGVAFVLAATGWWFILWHWAPIYGNILAVEFFQPLFATLKMPDQVAFFASANGIFAVCLITIALAGLFVSLGMEGYARIQKWCFYIGMAGLAVVFLLLLINDQASFQAATNRASTALFGTTGDVYTQTIQASQAAGYTPTPVGLTGALGPTLLLVPVLVFYLLWPNWGATLYGEVRGSSDFKRVLRGMFSGLWVTVILTIVFLALVAKTIGWDFYMTSSAVYWNSAFLVPDAPAPLIPIWPYPVMLAGWLIDSQIFQLLLTLVMTVWFIGWAGTLFLSSTRVIFAAAFDRVLPEWAARVSDRRHVPYGALALMLIPSVVISALYAYVPDFRLYTFDATLVIAVTFLGTALAATILPWRRPRIWANSPAARYKVVGLPAIAIAGAATAAFIILNLYAWLTNAAYGVNNQTSLIYMAALYALAIAIYAVAWYVRRREGVNLSQIHAEIPSE